MNIKIEHRSQCAVVHVSGRIDAITCDDLEDSLMTLMDQGQTHIMLEMSETEYISSAGLRVLIIASKQLYDSGFFCLIQVSDGAMEIIEMAGFNTIINVYDDVDAAMAGMDQ